MEQICLRQQKLYKINPNKPFMKIIYIYNTSNSKLATQRITLMILNMPMQMKLAYDYTNMKLLYFLVSFFLTL